MYIKTSRRLGSRLWEFDKEKAIEMVLYIITLIYNTKRTADPAYIRILKLIYFADKTHLEQYGRTISTDSYVALDNGIVPENIFEMFRDNEPVDAFKIEHTNVIALRLANTDLLSESDIKVMKRIVELYDPLPTWHLYHLSRDGAWAKTIANGGRASVDMTDLIDEVDIPEGHLMEHLLDNTQRRILETTDDRSSLAEFPPEDNIY